MRKLWVSLILALTAFLYKRKKTLLVSHSFISIFHLLIIISTELLLAIVSLPLYLTSKEKVSGNHKTYQLRRLISLSALLVILFIWLFKLVFIVGLPYFFNVKQTFYITEKKVTEQRDDLGQLLKIFNLKENVSLQTPQIQKLALDNYGALRVNGTAEPSSFVVLFISTPDSPEGLSVVFLTESNENGDWLIQANNLRWEPVPGSYEIRALVYRENEAASNFSSANLIEIKPKIQDLIITKIDFYLNYLVILFLALGIISLVLLL